MAALVDLDRRSGDMLHRGTLAKLKSSKTPAQTDPNIHIKKALAEDNVLFHPAGSAKAGAELASESDVQDFLAELSECQMTRRLERPGDCDVLHTMQTPRSNKLDSGNGMSDDFGFLKCTEVGIGPS